MQFKSYTFLIILLAITLSACEQKQMHQSETNVNWEQELASQIKLLGHRNWIVIADGAYPFQSNSGIKTITSDKSQLQTVLAVKKLIEEQKHIKANILLDKEIDYLTETNTKGIKEYREALNQLLGKDSQRLLHEEIITKLDKASELFNVIVIKTDFTIPYTTVFFELDCKYWSAEAEECLRKKIAENE